MSFWGFKIRTPYLGVKNPSISVFKSFFIHKIRKNPKIPKNSGKIRRNHKNSEKIRKNPKNSKKIQKFRKNPNKYKNSEKIQKFRKNPNIPKKI